MSNPHSLLITGAAGALGRAAVAQFLAQGARLVLVDRELSLLRTVFPDLVDDPGHLLLEADVTDVAAMQQAAAVAIQQHGRLYGLVHIAGGFAMGEPVHELSAETWQQMMSINAWSFVACARAMVPHLLAAGGGRVIAVSARSAGQGQAAMGAYIAAKSALQRLVETLSAEVREQGIAVNSIAPSIIDTPANRQAMPEADPALWVAPADLARTLAFLISDAGGAIHGQHLVVAGLS